MLYNRCSKLHKSLFLVFLLSLSNSSLTKEAPVDIVIDSVQEVCLKPGESGKHWSITAKGGADTGFRAPKILKLPQLSGEATFSHEEWDGVQRVLKEKQADENARYRDCVERLIPIFLDKFRSPLSQEPTQSEMESAVKDKFDAINASIRDTRNRCENREFENNPVLAIQCLMNLAQGQSSKHLGYNVNRFKKLGCERAVSEAGYICDYIISISSNNPNIQEYFSTLLGNGSVGQGRFINQDNRWLFLQISKS